MKNLKNKKIDIVKKLTAINAALTSKDVQNHQEPNQ